MLTVPNFMTLGNDCPAILKYNLRRLDELYPESSVFLYDWGHREHDLQAFKAANPRLEIFPWQANQGDYMYQKVLCIQDAYCRQADQALVYLDADVILVDHLDLFPASGWDIGATWRPDSAYKQAEFGVGTWLNAGVLFINNEQPAASRVFLQEWAERCTTWSDRGWWLDQVELIRLFAEAAPDLSPGPGRLGTLDLQGQPVRLKTLDAAVYNHLPEVYRQKLPAQPAPPKVLHLKSAWRKVKFEISPGWLKSAWIDWVASDYAGRPVLKRLNYGFNALLRYLLAKELWPK